MVADGLAAFRPRRDNVYSMLAAALLYSDIAAGRVADARADFDQALKLDPSNTRAQAHLRQYFT